MAEPQPQSIFGVFGQRKMAAILILGFASGLPLFLTTRTLQAWMTTEGVDLATIGYFSLVALPYSFKFLWAPFMDRFVPPFLGRRRGWLLVTQLLLMVAIAAMSVHDPRRGLTLLAVNAILLAFFSASQDVVFDAYRVDTLDEREMGPGAALGVLGYRIAMLLVGGVALILADRMPWPSVYLVMATLMVLGIAGTLLAQEPTRPSAPPQSIATAVVRPFREFFNRGHWTRGLFILLFVVLYKVSDGLVQNMSVPFLLGIGFTQTDVGAFQGVVGLGSTILGTIAGGVAVARFGINRCLWVFGILQAATNLTYYAIARSGPDRGLLTGAIVVENFTTGLVTATFVAFLMSLCSRRYSATQYALLSSLMAASRDIVVAPAGELAESFGWPRFFLATIVAGIPGLLLLPVFAPWNADKPLGAPPHGEAAEDVPDQDDATPGAEARDVRTLAAGFAGAVVGGVVGFLLRPAAAGVGQLGFVTVITLGKMLQGESAALKPLAVTSFRYLFFGVVIGILVAVLGTRVFTRRKEEQGS